MFFGCLAAAAFYRFVAVRSAQRELSTDHKSVKDYLAKATRDREQNRVAVAIQNRKAAAVLKAAEGLSDEDTKYLNDSIEYWGRRLEERRTELDALKDSDIWKGHDISARLREWIDAEFAARPLPATTGK